MSGQDVIMHLATETGTGKSMYCIEKHTEININGTAIILEILVNKQNSVKKMY
ncbi:hypothetical protein [Flavobacterium notoginsengisoli]|uniref:hypothetical protein n=1 Tax=Flavobacterium notoginsengisoli TaxID=1478199 RepID=UPI003644E991